MYVWLNGPRCMVKDPKGRRKNKAKIKGADPHIREESRTNFNLPTNQIP